MHKVVRELMILVLIITVRNIYDVTPDIFLSLQVRKKLLWYFPWVLLRRLGCNLVHDDKPAAWLYLKIA